MNQKILLKYTITLLLILVFNCLSQASNQYQSSYTLKNGLPSNNVHQIFSDSRDIVWITTDAGLFEFDNGNIIIRKELESLYGEKILSICEDNKHNLWLAVLNVGLCRFDRNDILIYNNKELGLEGSIKSVYFDKIHNQLLLGTNKGVNKVSIDNNKISLTPLKTNGTIDITSFIKNDDKLLAISSTPKKTFDCNLNSNKLNLLEKDNSPIIEFNKFNTAHLLNKHSLSNRTYKIRFKNQEDLDCEIIQVISYNDETFYLLRYFIADTEYRKIIKVSGQEVNDFSISNNIDKVFVQSIFIDPNEGNIWLGTRDKGILHFRNSIFQYFNASYFNLDKLNIADIESDSNGCIYIATKDEIIYFLKNKIKKRISTKELDAIKYGSSSTNSEHKIQIFDILNNQKSELWIATNVGFYTLNLKTNAIKYIGISPATKFTFTKNNEICLFWNNEFGVYSGNNFQEKKFSYKISKSDKISVSKMISKDSVIWFATKQIGIFRYKDGNIEHFNNFNSNIHNVINDLLLIPDGNIIAGGNNGCIYKLKYKNKKLNILGIINNDLGLTGTSIHGFQYLKDKTLWCGTNEGIYRFDYRSWGKHFPINYHFWNDKKGYFDQNGKNSIVDKDQNIWICTNKRLLKISKSEVDKLKKDQSSLNLTKVQVYNKYWQPDTSKFNTSTRNINGPINLTHKQNCLIFSFNFQNSLNPKKSLFRYKLKEFDNGWTNWSSNNYAIYSNLPSGEYTLNIQGKHLNKTDIIPLSIKISISYPWWKKSWFYAIIFASFVLFLITSIRIYTRKIRKEEEAKNKTNTSILGLKMKTLKNQLDPHFIFNALNSIQAYILEQETENALDYLSDFSTVLRMNIKNADKNFISLADEIAYLKHYIKLEQMRFMNQFRFEIIISNNINPYNFLIPPMMIQPFIENAIRFGLSDCKQEGLIQISFDLDSNQYISCLIEDSSISRSNPKEYDPTNRKLSYKKAMQNIQERINLLAKISNNNILKYDYKIFYQYDENQTPVGTKVNIGLPFCKTSD
ncbi:sensor histidine kinase [Ancylomarina sp. 16SWW S1-10-2]|uniref:sensor histidine kinase n=1 Tax=Ancylomarina sp. 16SWW S1-10-2 TaxID=2499681 RepID=UPI00189ED9EE|nr:sensor histidine kinase [Ancylomarina sp. 16SWW S1-10-2]